MKPLLVVGIRLQIPNAVLEPPIATIQDTINSVARAIAAVPLSVRPWTSDSAEDEAVVLFSPSVLEITRDTSIAKRVTSSRDVLLSLLRLTGVTATLSGSLDGVVAQFQRYDHLWQVCCCLRNVLLIFR